MPQKTLFEDNHILTIEEVRRMDKAERQALRLRLQTQPLFLLNNVLRTPRQEPLVAGVHDVIARVFVPPNPLISREHWSSLKGPRIYLGPRKVGKSTVGCACFASAILSDPEITLLILSGESGLAESLCREIQLMLLNSVVQDLFPEYKPKGTKSKIDGTQYWCPARSRDNLDRDATIETSTFYSVKAGHHPNFTIWLDDATNEQNCGNEEMIAKTIEQWRDCDPLVLPGGYQIFTGTRYADGDLPQVMLEESERDFKISGVRSHIYVCQPVWTVRLDGSEEDITARREREQMGTLTRDDVNILLDRLDTPELWKQYRQHPKQFAAQMLLCPEAESARTAVFSPGLLKNQTKPISEMPLPHQSEVYANFDLSGTGATSDRDMTCGVVGVREILVGRNEKDEAVPLAGKIMLVDCTLGRFPNPEALAQEIVTFFKNWNPKLVRLESALGARFLEPTIVRLAKEAGISSVRERLVFGAPSNKPNAKRTRIFNMALLMKSGLLAFFEGMPFLSEIHKQLEKFTASAVPKRNDGADSCAQLVEFIQSQPLPSIMPEVAEPLPPFEDIPEPFERRDLIAESNEASAAKYAKETLYPYL